MIRSENESSFRACLYLFHARLRRDADDVFKDEKPKKAIQPMDERDFSFRRGPTKEN